MLADAARPVPGPHLIGSLARRATRHGPHSLGRIGITRVSAHASMRGGWLVPCMSWDWRVLGWLAGVKAAQHVLGWLALYWDGSLCTGMARSWMLKTRSANSPATPPETK